eukprot:UN31587
MSCLRDPSSVENPSTSLTTLKLILSKNSKNASSCPSNFSHFSFKFLPKRLTKSVLSAREPFLLIISLASFSYSFINSSVHSLNSSFRNSNNFCHVGIKRSSGCSINCFLF